VNARAQVTLSDLSEDCDGSIGADKIRTGPITDQGWVTTRDHMPDLAYLPYLLTGQYYYLEEMQYQAAFIVGWKIGGVTETYSYRGRDQLVISMTLNFAARPGLPHTFLCCIPVSRWFSREGLF